ncbi:TIR domain-containing protein [Micromonospora sp. NPDC049175]|uniref:TIR domain-containing protein n=1 Tax=Micromonospora sp. NPDC049175 TaxID=3364266 RepID=UPI003712DA5E
MSAPVGFDIFVSYATADITLVMPWVERLRGDGFSVWFDQDQMRAGRSIMTQLSIGLDDSVQTIVFLTDTYLRREYTQFEMVSSSNDDPASLRGRTIPIKLMPLTVELPRFIRNVTICDFTDPMTVDKAYEQVKRSIRDAPPRPRRHVDEESVLAACEAPFEHLSEPDVALFLLLKAAGNLAWFLHRREIGEPGSGTPLETIFHELLVSGKLPAEVARSLTYIRTFGTMVVGEQIDRATFTRESIDPALAALDGLADWAFPDRPRRGGPQRILAALPRLGDPGEVRLPGTSLLLREPELARTALGPLFAGRDTAVGEEISIVLAEIPAQGEVRFAELIGRYASVAGSEAIVPRDTGTLRVGDGPDCVYLVFPPVRDISAAELAARHGGRLPAGPAYEIGLGVARVLARLHGARPPLAHGRLSPSDVLLSRYGSVRLRVPGRDPDSPEADLPAVPALLRTLLAGAPEAGDEALPAGAAETLRRLAGCRSVASLRGLLEEEHGRLPDEPDLGSLLGELAPPAAPATSAPELIESYPVVARQAWPLGAGRVLVWEADTETLAVYHGPRAHWRDDGPVPVRLAVTGRDAQVAVGGWDGTVRYFAGGELVAATRLDGTVGDVRFTSAGVVAGSWKKALVHLTAGGQRRALLDVAAGVHRIAVAEQSDRFAVADLSGRLAIYHGETRVRDWQRFGSIADIAYAGSRLVLLTEDGLTGMGVDHRTDAVEPKPGALRLLAGAAPGTCLLLVAADPNRLLAARLEAWSIDQGDRHILHTTFPAGYRIGSSCDVPGRYTVDLPDGGCAYWRDGAERQVWPDALAATLTRDGRLLAVCLPGRVELYAEHE